MTDNLQKVMHITFAPKPGGAEVYAAVCAKYLARAGHAVYLVYPPNAFAEFYTALEKHGVTCIELDLRKEFFKSLRFLIRFTKENDISVFHTHHYYADFIISVLRFMKSGITHVSSVHCMLKTYFKFGILKSIFYLMCFFSYHRADKIIAVSSETKDITERYFFLNRDKIHLIHNSIDFESLAVTEAKVGELRQRLNPQGAHKLLLCVGRLDERKGQESVIHAIGKYLKGTPVRFVMVGDGDYRDKFQKLAEEYEICDQIVFEGHQSDPWAYYCAADYFVIPSLSEGLAGTLLEAMYFGLPVIASDIGGNLEVIKHKENGYVVPVSDDQAISEALTFFMQNPQHTAAYAQAAQLMAKSHFSSQTMVKKIAQLYG